MLIKIIEDDHVIIKKIEWYPCVMGRSMHCDIQINHSSVSARHAVVEIFQNGFVVRDLGSKNGLFFNGQKVASLEVNENASFWLGDVKIEIVLDEHLAKTGPSQRLGFYSKRSGFLDVMLSVLVLMLGFLGAFIIKLYDFYAREWPPESYLPIFGQSFVVWLSGAGITGFISLFSKLNIKKFNFKKIAIRIFLFGFCGLLINKTMDTILFNLRQISGASYLDLFLPLIVVFFAINSIMYLVLDNISNRIRLLIGICLATSMVFVLRWGEFSRRDSSGRTTMTRFGLQFTDATSGIENDTEDLKTYLFRTIAEIDTTRSKIIDKADQNGEERPVKESEGTDESDTQEDPSEGDQTQTDREQ